MHVSDFHFDLPNELIARHPMPDRTASRLLQLDGNSGALVDSHFTDILHQVNDGDLLVFNNTRVIPARLFGRKASGGKIEVLVERVIDQSTILAHVRASKSPKPGTELLLGDDKLAEGSEFHAVMEARVDALFQIKFDSERSVLEILNQIGHMPLPPYIDRPDDDADKERYQTVYNEKPGAVAAPTAGLHFDDALLAKIKAKGVEFAYVTLHVGAGTFQPVRVETIEEHHMHAEYVEVPQTVVDAIARTKANGGRVIAVGTTSVRSLESAAMKALLDQRKADSNQAHCERELVESLSQSYRLSTSDTAYTLRPFFGDTDIFIFPGYKYQVVDALITNFHLPESTLIMLVSAFAGFDHVMQAYQHAVEQQYRFFSYGDAMFITPTES